MGVGAAGLQKSEWLNPPAAVPDTIGSMTALKTLLQDGNALMAFPVVVCQAPTLQKLHLKGNGIADIPAGLQAEARLSASLFSILVSPRPGRGGQTRETQRPWTRRVGEL